MHAIHSASKADDGFSLGPAGFRAVNNIFDLWELNVNQRMGILRLPKATYYKYLKDSAKVNFDSDQLERISLVLNMHASLRTVFNNRENVYGFIKMPNNNPFFNGSSPLSLIEQGDFVSLYEVAKQIDLLRGAQW